MKLLFYCGSMFGLVAIISILLLAPSRFENFGKLESRIRALSEKETTPQKDIVALLADAQADHQRYRNQIMTTVKMGLVACAAFLLFSVACFVAGYQLA